MPTATAKKTAKKAVAKKESTSSSSSTTSSPVSKPSQKPEELNSKPSDSSSGPRENSANLSGGNADSGKPEHPVSNPGELDDPVESYTGEPKVVDQDFIYPTHADPMRRLPGTSPYLDDVERQNAEVARAKAEGRKPDLENPPASQGTPLVTKDQYSKNIPGDVQLETDVTLPVVIGELTEEQREDDDFKKDYHK